MDNSPKGKSATEWTCEYGECKETFLRLPWEIKQGAKRFCSKDCSIKEQQALGRWGRKSSSPADPDSPKKCSKCGEEKDRSCFGKHVNGRDGLMAECKPCHVARTTKKYKENGGYSTDWRFKRHGISMDIFEEMLKSQGGGCAICGQFTNAMCIDHNHSHCPGSYGCSKCFRGVLCSQCNMAIGILKEDVKLFEMAIIYCS